MFDELMIQEVWRLALIAAVGGAVLGVLPRSRIRSVSIWTWALIPLAVATAVLCFSDSDQLGSSLSFVGLFLLASMLPWAGLVLLPYNLVRRARELHAGVDYRRVR